MIALETSFFPDATYRSHAPPAASRLPTIILSAATPHRPAHRSSRPLPSPQRSQQQQQQQYADWRVDMNALLTSLSESANAEELREVMSPYASTSTSPPRLRLSPRFMSSLLSRLPDWRRSLALLDWMHSDVSYPPSVIAYNVVLRNALRAGELPFAEGLVHEMQHLHGLPPDRFTYSTLIAYLGKAGRLDLSLRWLHRMERNHRISPDLVLYTSLIELARRLGDHSKAISLFSRLRRSGLYPDLPVLNSMLVVFGKAGLLRDARHLLDEMLSPTSPLARPDTSSFSTLLSAYVEKERYPEALSLFSKMRDRRVPLDLTTCNVMIDAYGRLGMPREADRLFRAMGRLGNGIPPGLVTYNTLLRVYGESDLLGEAAHLFRLMQSKGVEPNVVTYNTMIHIYGKALEDDRAGNLVHEMLRKGIHPNAITYSTIISIWEKAGKLDRAATLFEKLMSSGVEIDKVLIRTMLEAYQRAGLASNARQLLQELKDLGVGVDKETVISVVEDAGHVNKAAG